MGLGHIIYGFRQRALEVADEARSTTGPYCVLMRMQRQCNLPVAMLRAVRTPGPELHLIIRGSSTSTYHARGLGMGEREEAAQSIIAIWRVVEDGNNESALTRYIVRAIEARQSQRVEHW
jgi:hypothetical protein